MIEFLGKWIEGIAIAVILVSIFEMIIPNGNLKKYIKIVLGIYVVFSIIAPFVDSKKLYSIDVSEIIENYSQNGKISSGGTHAQENLEKIYKETLEKDITQTVEKQGYNVNKCIVKGIFNADNKNAGISKIEIVLDSKKEDFKKYSEQEQEDDENKIEIDDVKEIGKIEINVGGKSGIVQNGKEISLQDIGELKNFLAKHYEIDKKVIDIQKR